MSHDQANMQTNQQHHHHQHTQSSPSISSIRLNDENEKVSFFSALKKKLKGKQKDEKKDKKKAKDSAKEDDRQFEDSVRNFQEIETALMKLNDHMEKHLHAMQESTLYQQLIGQDLAFFFCTKGSYFAKAGDEYKQRCTDHLKLLSTSVFPALVQMTLQPIRAQLSSLVPVKELIELRMKQKSEVEAYRIKVGTLRKAAGLEATGFVEPVILANLPDKIRDKLGRKISKLNNLTLSYERMNSELLQYLVKYCNSKDIILNDATRSYLEVMQEYSAKNLLLHTQDVKLFLKNLNSKQAKEVDSQHRRSRSSLSSLTMARTPVVSNEPLLPLLPNEDDIVEAASNPLVLDQHHQFKKVGPAAATLPIGFTTNSSLTATGKSSSSSSSHLRKESEVDPSGLMVGFSKLREEAIARDQRKQAKERPTNGTTTPTIEHEQHNQTSTYKQIVPLTLNPHRESVKPVKPSSVPSQSSLLTQLSSSAIWNHPPSSAKERHSPMAHHSNQRNRASSHADIRSPGSFSAASSASTDSNNATAIWLYNNPPFNAREPFSTIHDRFSPRNSHLIPVPQAIETTLEAWKNLTRDSPPTSKSSPSAVTSPSSSSSSTQSPHHLPRVSSIDTKSHVLGSARTTIPIVSTAAFLQQHRAANSQPGSRRTSNAALPPPALGASSNAHGSNINTAATHNNGTDAISNGTASLSVPASLASPTSPHHLSVSPVSASSLALSSPSSFENDDSDDEDIPSAPPLDDSDDDIPPPPEPIDWDQISDSSSGEELSDDEQDHDTFVTPRAAESRKGHGWNASLTGLGKIVESETPDTQVTTETAGPSESSVTVTVPPSTETAPEGIISPIIRVTPPTPLTVNDLALSSVPTIPTPSSRASIDNSGIIRGKPILTGKFAALSEKFGSGAVSSRSAATSISMPTNAAPASTTTTAATAPSTVAASASTSSPDASSSVPLDSSEPTPLPTFDSPDLIPQPEQPAANAVTSEPVPLTLDDGSQIDGALLGGDVLATLGALLSTTSVVNASAPTASQAPDSTQSVAVAIASSPTPAPVPSSAFRSPFAVNSSQSTKSPFTLASQVTRSPFLTQQQQQQPSSTAITPTQPLVAVAAAVVTDPVSASPSPASTSAMIETPAAIVAAPNEQVIALYDYTPNRPIEIAFKKGDVLTVTSKDNSGWWTGFIEGSSHSGVFPSNYCKMK